MGRYDVERVFLVVGSLYMLCELFQSFLICGLEEFFCVYVSGERPRLFKLKSVGEFDTVQAGLLTYRCH